MTQILRRVRVLAGRQGSLLVAAGPLPVIAVPALWPLIIHGLPRSSDGRLHLLRLVLLDYHLRQGTLYPRWLPELLMGYGYPVFSFYAPASYYVAEFWHLLGMGFYAALATAFGSMILAAGLGAWLLARDVLGSRSPWPAIVAAAAYMYAPYLMTNVYVRGALAEVAAQAVLPWTFWSLRRVMRAARPARYVPFLALSLTALAITHTLALLLVPPALLGYLAVLAWQGRRGAGRSRLAWAFGGMAAAAGASAFFWLPALAQRSLLSEAALRVAHDIFLPQNVWTWRNFLSTDLAYRYTVNVPLRLGLVQLLLALAGLALARRRDAEWLFFGLLALAASVGIASFTLPIWQSSTILTSVQFPWRLLSLVSLALALLTAGAVAGPFQETATCRAAHGHKAQGTEATGTPLGARRRWPPRVPFVHSCADSLSAYPMARWLPAMAAALVVVAIVLADCPRLARDAQQPGDDAALTLPAIAQVEAGDSNTWGTTSTQDFTPRWADLSHGLKMLPEPDRAATGTATAITIESAGPYAVSFQINSPQGGPLRLTSFFFPGWQVVLDGDRSLVPYPSTNLGLLTVDVPAGVHRLHVAWTGALVERGAAMLSLLSLTGLAWFSWRRAGRGWLSVLLLPVLAAGTWAYARPDQPIGPAYAVASPIAAGGLQLAGYRAEPAEERRALYLYPYWYVSSRPAADLLVHWELRNRGGKVVAETLAHPYFGALQAGDWAAGTLVHDAYRLGLAPGLQAGTYELYVGFQAQAAEAPAGDARLPGSALAEAGAVQLPGSPPPARGYSEPPPADAGPATAAPLAKFGEGILLAAYDLGAAPSSDGHGARAGRAADEEAPHDEAVRELTVVAPGAWLDYTLHWRALGPLTQNYHGFVHLVDGDGQMLCGHDQLPGDGLRPPVLWDPFSDQPDHYDLQIPRDAPSGLYWPHVGLYQAGDLALLPASAPQGQALGDSYVLPPIKVVGRPASGPSRAVDARLGDVAILQGFDLAAPAAGVRPGDDITLTLYYQAQALTATDYTRFVHLYSQQLGMAAQQDGIPQDGHNPTWTWVKGETIVDRVRLQVSQQAAPGIYALGSGLYDRSAAGVRLPAYTAGGARYAGDEVALAEIKILSR